MRVTNSLWPTMVVMAGLFSPSLISQSQASETPSAFLSADGSKATDPLVVAQLVAPRPRIIPSAGRNTEVARWQAIYRSTEGRPIETVQLGEGARRIAIVGSVHGNESQSHALVMELARFFVESPDEIIGQTVLIIRSPNPDGMKAGSPFNARGVDLNRNFPTNNWKTLPKNRGGSKSGSEVETQALVKLLEAFRPDLVLHVKDTKDVSMINAEGGASEKVQLIARDNRWRDTHGLGQLTSGSLEQFTQTRLKCECITLLAQRQGTVADAWAMHKGVLVAAMSDQLIAAPATATTTRRRAGQTASSQGPVPIPRQSDPDEAVFEPRRNRTVNEDEGSIPEKGYYELPPSPR